MVDDLGVRDAEGAINHLKIRVKQSSQPRLLGQRTGLATVVIPV
jgi:hypothetical protein